MADEPTTTTRTRHGARNNYKMKLLVRWLQETFPHAFDEAHENYQSSHHILDVAGGGKGELATRLAWCCQRKVVIVDPRPTNVVQCLEKTVLPQLPKKWQQRAQALMEQEGDDAPLSRLQRLVKQHGMFFLHQNTLPQYLEDDDDPAVLVSAIVNASVLVGMHADSATEAIVDAALHYKKPFVVVPCCVFPNLFPLRMLPVTPQTPLLQDSSAGPATSCMRQVRSYEDFCVYLLAKDSRFQSSVLPFPGRNLAIWWDGED